MKLEPWLKFIVISILIPLVITIIGGVSVAKITTSTPKNHPGTNQDGLSVEFNFNIHIND